MLVFFTGTLELESSGKLKGDSTLASSVSTKLRDPNSCTYLVSRTNLTASDPKWTV